MNMRIVKSETTQKEDGRCYSDIEVFHKNEKKEFKNVPNIKKYSKCYQYKYGECVYFPCGALRFFDCQKRLKVLQNICGLVTGIIVGYIAYTIFFLNNVSIFMKLCQFILFLIALDVVFSVIETLIPFLRDKLLYSKLLRKEKIEKKKEEERQAEIQRKKEEEEEKEKQRELAETTFSKNISIAENYVMNFKKILSENDFGENNIKIQKCIERLEEIIEFLKKDNASYPRIAFLFEVYLPKAYEILIQYASLTETESDGDEDECKKVFTEFVDNFLKYLKSQKIEARLGKNKEQVVMQFKTLVKTLENESNMKKGE